jgi:hypothetical protein
MAVCITALLKVFNPLVINWHTFKIFIILNTLHKSLQVQNWSKHLTSSAITSQSLKYFMVDRTSLNERASFKFNQQKQSYSLKGTVHFSKYSKHTLYTEQTSFRKRSASFSGPPLFTLLRISCVSKERKPSSTLCCRS